MAIGLKEFKQRAKQGDTEAQFNLGIMYYYGYGVKQNYKKAFKCRLKAAKQGNIEAMNNLGTMYFNGKGVKQNYKKAEEWWLKAIKGYKNSEQQKEKI